MRRHLVFQANRRAPGQARRAVRDTLTRAGHDDVADTAEMLTSELVTNAVRHTDDDRVDVHVQLDGVVRVAVADDCQALPVLRDADELDTDGRGIALVNQLARRWGVEVHGGGKVVWFELSARRAAAAANRARTAARAVAGAVSVAAARLRKGNGPASH
jgi:anti-sigma regulatory factor (Ser/Thr protein kinase)